MDYEEKVYKYLVTSFLEVKYNSDDRLKKFIYTKLNLLSKMKLCITEEEKKLFILII